MKTFYQLILAGSCLSQAFADLSPSTGRVNPKVKPPSVNEAKIIPRLGGTELKLGNPNDFSKALAKRKQERARELEIRNVDGVLAEAEKPKSTCFQHSQIKKGRNLIAGTIRVIKAGSHSRVAFTTFKESHTFYNKFGNKKLEAKMLEKLKDGKPLPVMMTGYFNESFVRAGAKASKILVLDYVYSCEFVTEEAICKAAKLEEYSEQDCQKFSATFK